MSDWTEIPHHQKKRTPRAKPRIVNLDRIRKELPALIAEFNPIAVFLYGSMATGRQHAQSDIDLLFIWRYGIPENIGEIRRKIASHFQREIDLVNMIYQDRIVNDPVNELFLSNVQSEAKPIYGSDSKEIIYMSKLKGKNL